MWRVVHRAGQAMVLRDVVVQSKRRRRIEVVRRRLERCTAGPAGLLSAARFDEVFARMSPKTLAIVGFQRRELAVRRRELQEVHTARLRHPVSAPSACSVVSAGRRSLFVVEEEEGLVH